MKPLVANTGDFPHGPVAKTLCSQCRGTGFNPWLGNWIPHAATKGSYTITKSLYSTTKDPECCNKD